MSLQFDPVLPLQHRHASHNNWETPFDFTPENYERVRPSGLMEVTGCGVTDGSGARGWPVGSQSSCIDTTSAHAGSGGAGAISHKLQAERMHTIARSGPAAKQWLAELECNEQGGSDH